VPGGTQYTDQENQGLLWAFSGDARRSGVFHCQMESRSTRSGGVMLADWAYQKPSETRNVRQSPLKAKPRRLPCESVDKEIDRWVNDATLRPF